MIINLTQHEATPEQKDAGVDDLPPEKRAELQRLLTFDAAALAANPSAAKEYIDSRAREIVSRFVNPVLGQLASELLAEGGYTALRTQALHLLRPGTVSVQALIGGAPYLMAPLEKALAEVGAQAVYALSERESVEERRIDGTVRKVNVFKHVGFLKV